MANRSISDVHGIVELIERKQNGTFHTHAQIDVALDAGQKELFREKLIQKDFGALTPFKVTHQAFTTGADGIIILPDDCEYFRMAFAGTIAAPIPIRMVKDEEFPDAIKSQLRKVTAINPIGVLSTNTSTVEAVNIYPQAAYTGKMTYYKTPSTPKYNYTQVGRVITYSPTGSVQLQFSDIYIDKVIAKALTYLGISMDDKDIVQFSQLKEQAA
jgi:hypothetical protein